MHMSSPPHTYPFFLLLYASGFSNTLPNRRHWLQECVFASRDTDTCRPVEWKTEESPNELRRAQNTKNQNNNSKQQVTLARTALSNSQIPDHQSFLHGDHEIRSRFRQKRAGTQEPGLRPDFLFSVD